MKLLERVDVILLALGFAVLALIVYAFHTHKPALLKPHVMYLEGKGYDVTGVPDGASAIEILDEEVVDLVFLDENMPGISGLETLQKIKA